MEIKKIITKVIVCFCRKYDFILFRFGPMIPVKIELSFCSDNNYYYKVIDGNKVEYLERGIKKQLEDAFKLFKKDVINYFKTKKLAEKLKDKKNQPFLNVFKGETDVIRKSVIRKNNL